MCMLFIHNHSLCWNWDESVDCRLACNTNTPSPRHLAQLPPNRLRTPRVRSVLPSSPFVLYFKPLVKVCYEQAGGKAGGVGSPCSHTHVATPQMRHVAAYMMLVLGGNKAPTADDVKNVLSAAGIEADDTQLTRLIDALANKNIDEIVEAGSKKLAAMGGG